MSDQSQEDIARLHHFFTERMGFPIAGTKVFHPDALETGQAVDCLDDGLSMWAKITSSRADKNPANRRILRSVSPWSRSLQAPSIRGWLGILDRYRCDIAAGAPVV